MNVADLMEILRDADPTLPVVTAVDTGAVVCDFVDLDEDHARVSVIANDRKAGDISPRPVFVIWPGAMLKQITPIALPEDAQAGSYAEFLALAEKIGAVQMKQYVSEVCAAFDAGGADD